jgi:glutamate-1-semialdehyde 2,1-aminomutase
VATGGAQQAYNLDPDITCLGKVIGGGLPVGAYAGKRHIMEKVAPAGTMYQAGTLSGNPLAMAAGLATISDLVQPGVFERIEAQAKALTDGLQTIMGENGVPVQVGHAGTMFGMYFLKEAGAHIRDYASAKQYANTDLFGKFFHAMLEQGIYLAPSQFEAGFVSAAHGDAEISATLQAAETAIKQVADS